ncbi:MAG: biosis protein MshE [Gammaproteobacteria bacterium]|nr:biosis protein MshE [Gammaproteobacteria bacterium]
MIPRKKIMLGDLLVESKLISKTQLEDALAEQKKSGRKLGRVLIENGYITEDQMLEVLSKQLSIPFVDLVHFNFNPDVMPIQPTFLPMTS